MPSFSACRHSIAGATNDQLQALAQLTRLTRLDVYSADVIDEGFERCSALSCLQELYLSCDGITDCVLGHLRLPVLRRLHIGRLCDLCSVREVGSCLCGAMTSSALLKWHA